MKEFVKSIMDELTHGEYKPNCALVETQNTVIEEAI